MKQAINILLFLPLLTSISCSKNKFTCKCNVNADGDAYVVEDVYDFENEAISECDKKKTFLEDRHKNANYASITCQVN